MTDPKIARCYHDPEWRYVRSEATDIRALFNRIRAELDAKKPQPANVRPMKKAPRG